MNYPNLLIILFCCCFHLSSYAQQKNTSHQKETAASAAIATTHQIDSKTASKLRKQWDKDFAALAKKSIKKQRKLSSKKQFTKADIEKNIRDLEAMQKKAKLLQDRLNTHFQGTDQQNNQLHQLQASILRNLKEMRATGAASKAGL